MPSRKVKTIEPRSVYRGRQARTGNSLGLRFEKALFQSHPEFSGEVRAHVIAPGKMLVVAEMPARRTTEDPVIAGFLSFLEKDMATAPGKIRQLDRKLLRKVDALVRRIPVNPEEDLGDKPLI